MSVYFITGKLGAGKTLAAVGRIRDYLQAGRPIATNLDLNLDKLLGIKSKTTFLRIPDKPTVEDLEALGRGSNDVDESTYGAIVLDELGTWLNSRAWNDKARAPVLNWFLHARKLGWDVFFIVQDIAIVDKQLREALCEYLVICRRLDRLPIFQRFLPKIHVGTVLYGDTDQAPKVDRWWYRGKDLYDAYDTRQVFSPFYESGLYTQLSPWLELGRYEVAAKRVFDWQKYSAVAASFVAGIAVALSLVPAASELSKKQADPVKQQESTYLAPEVSAFAELEPLNIIGSLAKTHIFRTPAGDFSSQNLRDFGFKVKYLDHCMSSITSGNQTLIVRCKVPAIQPQDGQLEPETELVASSGVSSKIADSFNPF